MRIGLTAIRDATEASGAGESATTPVPTLSVAYSPRELHRIRRIVEGDRAYLIRAIDTVCERAWR